MSLPYNGNYSSDLYNPAKRYRLNFQKGVALADSEIRELQSVSDQFIRQLISANFPSGSTYNDGFKIVGNFLADGDFLILGGDGSVNGAGIIFVDGYMLFAKSNFTFKSQDATGALTDDDYTKSLIDDYTWTSGTEQGSVWLDFYFAEVAPVIGSEYQDTSLLVSGLGVPTANRVRQVQDIIAFKHGAFSDIRQKYPTAVQNLSDTALWTFTDANGIFHRCVKLAAIARSATIITPGMVTVDHRIHVNSLKQYYDGTATTIKLTTGSDIGDATHRIGTLYMNSAIDFNSNFILSNAGAEKMRVQTDGKIGIGSSVPLTNVDIFGAANQNLRIKSTGGSANVSIDGLAGATQAANLSFAAGGLATFSIKNNAAADQLIITDDTTAAASTIVITAAGRIGLGTATPQSAIHLHAGTGTTTITGNLSVTGTTTIVNTEITTTDKFEIDQDENQQALIINKTANGAGNVIEVNNTGTGNALIITGSGNKNVGIGTTSAAALLHLMASPDCGIKFQYNSSTNNRNSIGFSNAAGNSLSEIQQGIGSYRKTFTDGFIALDNDLVMNNVSAAALHLATSDVVRLSINALGKIGIGSTNPGSNLDVFGSLNQSMTIKSTAGSTNINFDGIAGATASNNLSFFTSGSALKFAIRHDDANQQIVIDNNAGHIIQFMNSGAVGIGTTPAAKFHIKATTNVNIHMSDSTGASVISSVNDANNAYVNMKYRATKHTFEQGPLVSLGNIGIGTDPGASTRLEIKGIGDVGASFLTYMANSSGVQKFTVLDNGNTNISGNVGIGTTPYASVTYPLMIANQTLGSGADVGIGIGTNAAAAGTNYLYLAYNHNSTSANKAIKLGFNNETPALYIKHNTGTNTNLIGINTANPTNPFEVWYDAKSVVNLTHGSGNASLILGSNGPDKTSLTYNTINIGTSVFAPGYQSFLTFQNTNRGKIEYYYENDPAYDGYYVSSKNVVLLELLDTQATFSIPIKTQSNFLGNTSNTSNLGSPTNRFANLYMASNVDHLNQLNFNYNGNTNLRITTAGRVGIGTNFSSTGGNVAQDLQVAGTVLIDGGQGWNSSGQLARLFLGNTGYGIIAVHSTKLLLQAGGGDVLEASSATRDVGIGGAFENGTKLKVTGSAKVTNNLTVSGISYVKIPTSYDSTTPAGVPFEIGAMYASSDFGADPYLAICIPLDGSGSKAWKYINLLNA